MNMFENVISEMSEEKLNDLILGSMSVDEKKERVLKMFINEAVHVAAIEDKRVIHSWQENAMNEIFNKPVLKPSNRKWHFENWSDEEKVLFDELVDFVVKNEQSRVNYRVYADVRDQVMFDIFLNGILEPQQAINEYRCRMVSDWPTGNSQSPIACEQVPNRYFYRWKNNIDLKTYF
jgi:hypothetical protein